MSGFGSASHDVQRFCDDGGNGRSKKAIVETRVKQELLTGCVTSSEDVIRVALEHCDVPITEDGMTACIDEDGRIQVTQVLNTSVSRSSSDIKEVALTKLVITDRAGAEAPQSVYTDYLRNSGGMNEYSIFATHTSYFSLDVGVAATSLKVKLLYMTTTLTYGTAMKASKLQQSYAVKSDAVTAEPIQRSAVISSPAAGTAYSYTPSTKWYNPTSGNLGGQIDTGADITVSGTNKFSVKNTLLFSEDTLGKFS